MPIIIAPSILTALALNLVLGWWWADPAAALVIELAGVPACVEIGGT